MKPVELISDKDLLAERSGELELLNAMVDHARTNKFKVIALWFVHAQFKRHPEEYADILNKS